MDISDQDAGPIPVDDKWWTDFTASTKNLDAVPAADSNGTAAAAESKGKGYTIIDGPTVAEQHRAASNGQAVDRDPGCEPEEPPSAVEPDAPANGEPKRPARKSTARKRTDKERGGQQNDSLQQEAGEIHLTDNGNARRVVQRHGADLRFCHPWGKWLVWDGRRWKEDATAEAERRVKETRDSLFKWAAKKLAELGDASKEDNDERKKQAARYTRIIDHCLRWEDARRVSAALQLARSEPGIPILPEDLDRDPFLLNVVNGTLDLRTGQLRRHRQEDYLTKLAAVEYDPDALCPLWLKFLERIMDRNRDLIDYLQRVVGHALTGDVSEQALWFLYGTGANGKSTFLGTILAVLGDYGMQAVSDLLLAKHNESHPTERADLFGKRFVATIETEDGKRMAESLMKQLTGGDKVRARKMRQDFFEFDPTHKIFLAANHKPTVRGTDHAAWRRIKLVPFTVTIGEQEKDKKLAEKLKAERPGILAWAVRGCLAWQQAGLQEPEEVKQATDQYQAEQDLLAAFLRECCFVNPQARCMASAALEAYCKWSGDRTMTQKAFGNRLREMGFEAKRGHGGNVFYHGIGLPESGGEGHG